MDEAIHYEKQALALITAMKKPKEIDQQDFDSSIAGLSWRAYSGLGLAYFRQKDYAESASALQSAVKNEGTEPDAGDLLALGIDLENLNRKTEAVDAFSKCFQISGDLQDQCEQDLQKAKGEISESPEDAAYEAFTSATNADAQIQLGEKFDQIYPTSEYEERVDTALVGLYRTEQQWTKLYATADKVLAKDANNVPVLAAVAWTISHNYDASDPNASAKLDQAEKDGKHALDLIAAMQKPADLTEQQFDQAKEQATAQAHSGLGIAYFRQGDFADSANELQLATSDASQASAFDFYVLGIDLQKVNRTREAADAFTKCGSMAGALEAQCKRDAEAASATADRSQAAAQLAGITANPSPANLLQPRAADVPISTAQESPPVIKAETVLVPVRVVVRNTNGKAVAVLKKEDFKLYQDGKQVEISTFTAVKNASFNTTPSAGAKASPGGGSDSATSTLSGTTAAPAASTPAQFVALFFDDLHLYFADLAQTPSAAEKYLATLHPEDRVAIVTASGEGELDFTSDRDALENAIDKLQIHTFPGATTAVAHAGGPCPPPMTYTEAHAIDYYDSGAVAAIADGDFVACRRIGGGATMAKAGAEDEAASAEVRAAATRTEIAGEEAADAVFKGLQGAVKRLSSLPGRRIVEMVSPGFVYSGHQKDFAEIINLALHYNVVINTLDAKGIYEVGFTDLHRPGAVGGGEGVWDPDRFEQFGFGHFEVEQPILEDLADATGGRFVKNNNDFAGVLREFGEAPEAYYLLSYSPQNLEANGKYHVLKVSLARRSLDTVQARRGFYAPSRLETPEEAAKREIDDAVFSDDEQHGLPVKFETQLAQDASGARKLTVRGYVDVSRLDFQRANGVNAENLIVAAALFDNNGNYVEGTQKSDQMDLKDATLAQLKKTGFYLEMDFDVKPGDYTVRMVARDANDQHITAQNATVDVP